MLNGSVTPGRASLALAAPTRRSAPWTAAPAAPSPSAAAAATATTPVAATASGATTPLATPAAVAAAAAAAATPSAAAGLSPPRTRQSLWDNRDDEVADEDPLVHSAVSASGSAAAAAAASSAAYPILERPNVSPKRTRTRNPRAGAAAGAAGGGGAGSLLAGAAAGEGEGGGGGAAADAQLYGMLAALREEVRGLEARVDAAAAAAPQTSRRLAGGGGGSEGVGEKVEQAVRDALALYADQGVSALVALTDELNGVATDPTEPRPHQNVCRSLKEAIEAMVSAEVARQVGAAWEDAALPVPRCVARHVAEEVEVLHGRVDDEVCTLAESHPLAPRVAAVEAHVSRMVPTPAPAGPSAPDAAAAAAVEERLRGVEAAVAAVEGRVEEESAGARLAEVEQALVDVQEKQMLVGGGGGGDGDDEDGAGAGLSAGAAHEVLARVERAEAAAARLREDVRGLRGEVAAAHKATEANTLRSVGDSLKRTRADLMEHLALLKKESATKKELAADRKRTAEALQSLGERVAETEGEVMEDLRDSVEAAKAGLGSRLSKVEEDVGKLQGVGTDVVYLKAAVDSLESDVSSRLAAMDSTLAVRSSGDAAAKKLEARTRDLEARLASKYLSAEQAEAVHAALRQSVADTEDHCARLSASVQQALGDTRPRRAAAAAATPQPAAAAAAAEQEIRDLWAEVRGVQEALPAKLEATALAPVEAEVKELRRRVAERAAADAARGEELDAAVEELGAGQAEEAKAVRAALAHAEAEVKDVKRRLAERAATDAKQAAELRRLEVDKADAAEVLQATAPLEAELRELKKRAAERASNVDAAAAEGRVAVLAEVKAVAEEVEAARARAEEEGAAVAAALERLQAEKVGAAELAAQEAKLEKALAGMGEEARSVGQSDLAELQGQIEELGQALEGETDALHKGLAAVEEIVEETREKVLQENAAVLAENEDVKGRMMDINDDIKGLQREVTEAAAKGSQVEGFVQTYTSSRDLEMQEVRRDLHATSVEQQNMIKQLQRALTKANIALDLNMSSQPGTPREESSVPRSPVFGAKKQAFSAAVREQTSG